MTDKNSYRDRNMNCNFNLLLLTNELKSVIRFLVLLKVGDNPLISPTGKELDYNDLLEGHLKEHQKDVICYHQKSQIEFCC